jgi:cyclic dehypoxanthinyl futalosine synthase
MQSQIEQKIQNNERITDEEAKYLYTEASLEDLQKWATQVRGRFHEPKQATYLIMRIINYTNICVALCDYCAFYRLPHSEEGYVLTLQQIYDKIDELLVHKGDMAGFNGGFNPNLKIDWYVDIFTKVRERYGDRIEFYGMTVAELMYAARRSDMTDYEAAKALKEAGVRWITGGGAEILTNEFRERHSPHKYTADEFIAAQEGIHKAGVNTTATMVIGFDETLDERIEHLHRCRDLQDETGCLFSMLTWTYKPYNTELGGNEVSHEEYLRHLAVCRIYLDNVKHLRASVLTQNENALKGLHYGANDFDIPLEDEVTELAGAVINRNVEDVLNQARKEGFEPVYRHMALKPDSHDA